MKLVYKNIDKKLAGSVSLVAEEAEDMWHAYNLINVGDYLRSTTIRRVVNESAVGLTTTSRVRITLTIQVKNLEYDTHASVLRVKGTNFEENQFVKMGAYHTIDLELNRKFEITKNEWDSVALARIDEACDPVHTADLAAVVMQEGLANVCLIQASMTVVKAKIEMNIPRKRKGMCANHDKNMEKFFERIIQALLTHINFDIVKAVIVASPGFIKDQFYEFMNAYAVRNIQTCKLLVDNKSKFLLVHSASGFKHAIREIFEDPNLAPRLVETKALGEVKALEAFYQMLKVEPTRAYYGYKHVEKAKEADAIDVLLISDSLFRSKELAERKKYVNIVDKVRENNGQVKIFSSLHVSGEQLLQLTGIAAILRFPMPELEDEELSDSDDDEPDEDINNKDEPAVGQLNGAKSDLKESASTANFQPAMAAKQSIAAASAVTNSVSSPAMPINKSKINKKFTNKENNTSRYNDDDDYEEDFSFKKTGAGGSKGKAAANYDYYDDDDYDF